MAQRTMAWMIFLGVALPAQAMASAKGAWLAPLVDPNIVYLMLVLGLYGMIFELASPGLILPGLVGGASFVLGLYALQFLPVNGWGLTLIGLGVALMLAEGFKPSYGLFGIGGLAAFIAGSLMLFQQTDMEVSRALVGGTAAVSAVFFLWVIMRALRLRRKKPVSGREDMIGSRGEVIARDGHHIWIRVHGERWEALSAKPLRVGQKVQVTGMDGLQLKVEPIEE